MPNLVDLQATATKTADWTSSWVDFGGNQDRWKFKLTLASFTGASTLNTVVIQGSRDKDHLSRNPAQTLGTFPTNNDNVSAETITIDLAKYADCRFIRALGTVTTVKATGTLTCSANPLDNETVTLGAGGASKVYRFKNTTAQALDVKIGADLTASLANLRKAINATGLGDGTDYHTGTTVHTTIEATASDATTLSLRALTGGTGGNSETTTETLTNGSFGGATLSGGTDHSSSVTVTHQSANAAVNSNQDGSQE